MIFPDHIFSGVFPTPHCQGIALDKENGFLYYSFTTMLVKTDLAGKLIGTVDGLTGHLGCIAFWNGRVYGSLEYKNDSIGRYIHEHLGLDEEITDAFYCAIFDVEKIDRVGMDASSDGVMKAAFLKEVLDDFHGVSSDGLPHHLGCSGIDGMTFGPAFGEQGGKEQMAVTYGVYHDETRSDNDHQVILTYEPDALLQAARPLDRHHLHTSGPEKTGKYFVFTGNTDWGVQNFEYDRFTGDWLMAVYPGYKPEYPNCPLYILDGKKAPVWSRLKGLDEEGFLLTLKKGPVGNAASDVAGWSFPYGSTGLFSFGDGKYYISHNGSNDKGQFTDVYLYRYSSADDEMYFARVQ